MMPYREKTAWLALIAMLVTFAPYFTIVALNNRPAAALPDLRQLGIYAVTAIAFALITGLGHLYLRHRAPQEARTPPDERDRAIKNRSMSSAYVVLLTGMIIVGVIMPFNSGGWTIVHAALFTIVFAEIVHNGVAVLSYRRQS